MLISLRGAKPELWDVKTEDRQFVLDNLGDVHDIQTTTDGSSFIICGSKDGVGFVKRLEISTTK